MVVTRDEFSRLVDETVRRILSLGGESPEEGQVRQEYERYYDILQPASFPTATEEDKLSIVPALVKRYCSEFTIKKKVGFAYFDDSTHKWLDDVEAQIGWKYWNRYKDYLLFTKRWSKNAVRTLDRDTYNLLDLMADPRGSECFERRGLVVASVQSGKTSNYIGVISRAADAGFKLIIVMAGVHNVLRSQTQQRIEEGFTGFTIENNTRQPVGVGLTKPIEPHVMMCTTRAEDFNKRRAGALMSIQVQHVTQNVPLIFVIKKNSNALKQVYEWLKSNANSNDPILIIDDEADNASINGKYKREHRDDEPTRINGQIRNILSLFSRCCYLGYTATPYANILIDPDLESEDYGRDLFPGSFIYTLSDSSDYFGAEKVFGDFDEPRPRHLRFIDDIDDFLPPKHKSTYKMHALPDSLKEAIRAFVLADTIRSLRGQSSEHCTMMVNVSPYKIPQKSVADCISDYLEVLRESVNALAGLPVSMALSCPSDNEIVMLKETWSREYETTLDDRFIWDEVQPALIDSVARIHVVSINTDSNDVLNYDGQVEHVIAVGGYRLSRGLTLEGLTVSYYSRNAKAYDALMQMARWFGYRAGYEDLCRIWMSQQAAGWYKFVADSTDDLIADLREMRQLRSNPRDYGLKIQRSPDSLTVTARNKMGTGKIVKAPIDLNNGFAETVSFVRDRRVIDSNIQACFDLLRSLDKASRDATERFLFRNVPVCHIKSFLSCYKNDDTESIRSQTTPILNYIDGCLSIDELTLWDVLVAQGGDSDASMDLPVVGRVSCERRSPGLRTNGASLVVGENNRLASRGVEKAGLTEGQIERAEERFRAENPERTKNCSDRYYRAERTKPLLVIHPVNMKFGNNERSKNWTKIDGWGSPEHQEKAIGWSISFPKSSAQANLVDYVFNEVALKNISSDFREESDDDYADD